VGQPIRWSRRELPLSSSDSSEYFCEILIFRPCFACDSIDCRTIRRNEAIRLGSRIGSAWSRQLPGHQGKPERTQYLTRFTHTDYMNVLEGGSPLLRRCSCLADGAISDFLLTRGGYTKKTVSNHCITDEHERLYAQYYCHCYFAAAYRAHGSFCHSRSSQRYNQLG